MINYVYNFLGFLGIILIIVLAVWLFLKFTRSSLLYKQIEAALQEKDFEKARKLCLGRIDSQPNDFILKYYLGQALEGLKDYPGAILYYEKAAISASSTEDENLKNQIHLRTAILLKKTHKDKEALGYFAIVLDHEPQNTKALFACAEVYFELKNFEKARQMLQTHLSIKPEHLKSKFLLGEIDMETRRYPEAIEQFESIIDNEANVDEVIRIKSLIHLTDACMETKIFNKAKNALLELMKNDEQYEDAVLKMIQIKIRSDAVAETLGFIQQNLDNLSSVGRSLALYNMGNLYYKNGNYYEAVDAWRKAYALNPSNKDLQNMINHYSVLINNQNLRGLFTDDAAQGETFIKNLMKNNLISNITKMKKYWAFQNYDAFYVIYRVPQPITPEELLEIKDTVSKFFNKANSFTLYSLYGVEYSKTYEADVKDLTIVTEKDFLALVNANVC